MPPYRTWWETTQARHSTPYLPPFGEASLHPENRGWPPPRRLLDSPAPLYESRYRSKASSDDEEYDLDPPEPSSPQRSCHVDEEYDLAPSEAPNPQPSSHVGQGYYFGSWRLPYARTARNPDELSSTLLERQSSESGPSDTIPVSPTRTSHYRAHAYPDNGRTRACYYRTRERQWSHSFARPEEPPSPALPASPASAYSTSTLDGRTSPPARRHPVWKYQTSDDPVLRARPPSPPPQHAPPKLQHKQFSHPTIPPAAPPELVWEHYNPDQPKAPSRPLASVSAPPPSASAHFSYPMPTPHLAPARTPSPLPGSSSRAGREARVRDAHSASSRSASPDPTIESPEQVATAHLRKALGLTEDEPASLLELADPPAGCRPEYALNVLAVFAINDSPRKMLSLSEIYWALEARFPWFEARKNEKKGWKGSIRHMLSLDKIFRPVERPVTEPGRGHWWALDLNSGRGYKRMRKRGRGRSAGGETLQHAPWC